MTVVARAVDVARRCGEVQAVKRASVAFEAGKIHAVCGENGAGKTTLLKIVAGMMVPDSGHVEAFGSTLIPHTPREAIRRGVGMVLQHFALVPVLSAIENVILGAEPTRSFGILDLGTARTRLATITAELGVTIPLDEPVERLGVGDRQRLEIARALYREAKLLILDEPTAVLTKGEAAALYATLRRLARGGTAVVVVTHKMDEVAAHADTVTVMRRGELVFTRAIDRSADVRAQVDAVTAAIMGAVHGEDAPPDVASDEHADPSTSAADREVVLALRDVRVGTHLAGVSLSVRAGEIVGIAGVEGNGQGEIVGLLSDQIALDGGSIEGGPCAIVHEDRQREGLVLDATLRDNAVLGELERFTKVVGLLDLGKLEAEAKERVDGSGAPKDLEREARTLSGGNQQKIVVARALARVGPARARVVVAAQPTRGVDLAASGLIHERLRDVAKAGAGVLVISADLDELRRLASRIAVLARGRVVAELPPTATDEEFGRLMLGLGREATRDASADPDEASRDGGPATKGAS